MSILERLRNEPVLLAGLVTAVVGLLVAFGVDVSDDVKAAIITFVGAVSAVVARQRVTPG